MRQRRIRKGETKAILATAVLMAVCFLLLPAGCSSPRTPAPTDGTGAPTDTTRPMDSTAPAGAAPGTEPSSVGTTVRTPGATPTTAPALYATAGPTPIATPYVTPPSR